MPKLTPIEEPDKAEQSVNSGRMLRISLLVLLCIVVIVLAIMLLPGPATGNFFNIVNQL